MAGLVGARPRGGAFAPRRGRPIGLPGLLAPRASRPGRGAEAGRAVDLPRRTLRGATVVRAQRRQARVGYVMIGIVTAFLLGLFSLSQTVRVSAMDYDVNGMLDAQQQLEATGRDLRADLARLGGEPSVRAKAHEVGLEPLVEPIVVPAR